MSTNKSWAISDVPLISHLLHWGSRSQHKGGDGQGLLADDSLSIPLEDQRLNLNKPIQRELSPYNDSYPSQRHTVPQVQCPKGAFSQLLCLFHLRQAYLISAMVALILLLVFLGTRARSAEALGDLLLCGSQRYSISNVSICPLDTTLILTSASKLAITTTFSVPLKTDSVR
jgi:hypothetical protein